MGVIVATWVVAGLLVAGYIWFMVWRLRVDRRKKAGKDAEASPHDATAATLDRILKSDTWPPAAPTGSSPQESTWPSASQTAEPVEEISPAVLAAAAATAPTTTATPAANGNSTATDVTESLAGIRLPNDLVPLTTLAPRPGADDRVAFWTNSGRADDIGQNFAAELERLGYRVNWIENRMMAAERDGNRLIVVVHPDADKAMIENQQAFSSVPENAVVVEVWRP
jgi:hypothetical protein